MILSPIRIAAMSIAVASFLCSCGQRESAPSASKNAEGPQVEDYDYYATTAYIGDMYYFSNTEEFVTTAYLLPEFKELTSREVASHTDSTVFQSPGFSRQRLPMERARKWFVLSGMDTVSVFSMTHRPVAKVMLRRIEVLREGGKVKYIAVYGGQRLETDPDAIYYCVNRTLPELQIANFSYTQLNDPSLDNYLRHLLRLTPEDTRNITNVSVAPAGLTYSIVTTPSQTYLTELKDNHFNILREMNGRHRIDRIVPLPFEFNGRPLLLVFLYIPGSAERTVSLGVYTAYTEYRFLSYNRLRLKSIGREVQFGM